MTILDKDGRPLSPEEEREYTDDLFDGGIPMSQAYARDYLWPKWGARLGIPEPKWEEEKTMVQKWDDLLRKRYTPAQVEEIKARAVALAEALDEGEQSPVSQDYSLDRVLKTIKNRLP